VLLLKKVCFVTTIPLTMQAFVLETAMHLHDNADVEIAVICGYDEGFAAVVPEYIRYIPVSMKRGVDIGGLATVVRLWRIFTRERFDLVQYSTPNAAFYASIAAALSGVPVRLYAQMGLIYVGFTGPRRRVFKMIEMITCALSSRIEAVSHSNLLFGRREGLYPAAKSVVIWNGSSDGVNLHRFDIARKPEWRRRIREVLGVPADAVVFGFVGRITRDKGVNELLEAFRGLLSTHPDAHLLLVGDPEHVDSIEAGLYEWALLEPQVAVCGLVHNVEEYYAAMDVFVLPSYREGFGSVVIEAEAMGVPVIVTDIPGPTDAIVPNETGILVAKQSTGSLIAAMRTMAADRSMRLGMGRAGHQFVARNFDHDLLMAHILEDRKTLLGLA
jgi:glycosyltransferase involved in cell wall biosynthesis